MLALLRTSSLIVAVMFVLSLSSEPAQAEVQDASFENLQVLPNDISRGALRGVMIENLRGLGLPRRQNEGCLFCHVGDMERPTDEWVFEAWLERNPDHAMARRRLTNLRAGG